MKEDLITFHTAVLARELGFEEPVMYYCVREWKGHFENDFKPRKCHVDREHINSPRYYSCIFKEGQNHLLALPTQYQLSKWLRVNHSIIINVYANASGYLWESHYTPIRGGSHIMDYAGNQGDCKYSGTFTTYEKAFEQALSFHLKLIKREKQNNKSS